jgi:hypothetical protein
LKNPRPESDLDAQRNIQYGFNPVGGGDGVLTPNNLIAEGSVGKVTVTT